MVEKTHTYPSSSQHVGEMKDDQGTVTGGKGIHVFGYVGEWKDGKKNGQGTYTYSNGGQYVGEYEKDKRHGQGAYTKSNGDKYVGEWRNDDFLG